MFRPTTTCCLASAFALAVTLASAQTVETPTIDDAAISTPSCMEQGTDDELFTPASGGDVTSPVDIDGSEVESAVPAGKPMRGYCRCTCSLIPNCSTNADCGGGLCLKGPTCC